MRSGILIALALILAAPGCHAGQEAAATQPEISDTVTAGGLSCFTITPAPPLNGTKETLSCEQLCAEYRASCTGVAVGAYNPPPNCASRYITPNSVSCRCCKVP